ncbi:hypothetical protein G5A78_11240 [[Clostridium] scindens]|uniref:hypothetical protein n=1 Tax=Clostridium scindens (strain JCM 10418 / VPI 12708) TaxID=29347 RepID=UPI00156F3C1C|nr:hypothetical protein [[Clostridium] scindens]NSJ15430.1 hypothetical protein [[Clostridium] scindens]
MGLATPHECGRYVMLLLRQFAACGVDGGGFRREAEASAISVHAMLVPGRGVSRRLSRGPTSRWTRCSHSQELPAN